MICWYCYWGWPKQVSDIFVRGVEAAGESAMLYGPRINEACKEIGGKTVVAGPNTWTCIPPKQK